MYETVCGYGGHGHLSLPFRVLAAVVPCNTLEVPITHKRSAEIRQKSSKTFKEIEEEKTPRT